MFPVEVTWTPPSRSHQKNFNLISKWVKNDASDHLWQIWKESIEDCRRCRADTSFKVKTERPWKYSSRWKVITCDTLFMLLIICTKYGKNPFRTVDATEWTWFSRSRPNDLENIGQSQRSLDATHLLMQMIICAKYGNNANRIVGFYSRWKPKN